jgi:hypothetical protein
MNMGTAMKLTQAMAKMEDAVGALSKVCQDDLHSAEVSVVINQIVKCKEELGKMFERLLSQDDSTENDDSELKKMIEENRLI